MKGRGPGLGVGEGWGAWLGTSRSWGRVGNGGAPSGPPSPPVLGLILLLSPAGSQQLQLPGGEGDDGARAQLGEWHQHPWQTQPRHPPHLVPTSPL